MVPNSENKVENQEKKSWLLTLPGLFTATAALLTAIGGIVTLFLNYSHQTGTTPPPPPATAAQPTPPKSVATISLPGADWQGWLDESAARCRDQHHAVAIGLTELKSKMVVCFAGPGDLYFKAVLANGRAIELPAAERNEGGFDVTTEVDGTIYERRIRNDKFTILKDGAVIESAKWRLYASS